MIRSGRSLKSLGEAADAKQKWLKRAEFTGNH
jgi:hypothetical protein